MLETTTVKSLVSTYCLHMPQMYLLLCNPETNAVHCVFHWTFSIQNATRWLSWLSGIKLFLKLKHFGYFLIDNLLWGTKEKPCYWLSKPRLWSQNGCGNPVSLIVKAKTLITKRVWQPSLTHVLKSSFSLTLQALYSLTFLLFLSNLKVIFLIY